jgi:hypothetical protein
MRSESRDETRQLGINIPKGSSKLISSMKCAGSEQGLPKSCVSLASLPWFHTKSCVNTHTDLLHQDSSDQVPRGTWAMCTMSSESSGFEMLSRGWARGPFSKSLPNPLPTSVAKSSHASPPHIKAFFLDQFSTPFSLSSLGVSGLKSMSREAMIFIRFYFQQ